MDNITLFDIFVREKREKRVFSHKFNYLKHEQVCQILYEYPIIFMNEVNIISQKFPFVVHRDVNFDLYLIFSF